MKETVDQSLLLSEKFGYPMVSKGFPLILEQHNSITYLELPWPSGNALDSDQHIPGFEAQRRSLVTPGSASGLKCSRQN